MCSENPSDLSQTLLGGQMLLPPLGVVHIGLVTLVPSFEIFPKFASRLLHVPVPDGCVEHKISGYRCHFRAFQLELDTIDTKNFEIISEV